MSKKRYEREHNWIIDNNKRNTNESIIVYDEEWNTLDDICELFNKQNQKIADLEAKLAESESRFQTHKQTDVRTIQEQTDLIEELKQQLAEKEKEIDKLEDKLHHYYEETLNNGTCGVCKYLRNEYKTDFAIEQILDIKEKSFGTRETKIMFDIPHIQDVFDNIEDKLKDLMGDKYE